MTDTDDDSAAHLVGKSIRMTNEASRGRSQKTQLLTSHPPQMLAAEPQNTFTECGKKLARTY